MRKRLVAALLATALCLSAPLEAGAAALDGELAADFTAEAIAEEITAENTETPAAEQETEQEVPVDTQAPETEIETTQTTQENPVEEIPEETFIEDGFTSGEDNVYQEPDGADIGMYDGVADDETQTNPADAGAVQQENINCWKWDSEAKVFRYYGEDGNEMTMAQVDALLVSQGKYTGYYEIDNEYYCLDGNGAPRTGDITLSVNGTTATYYFDPTPDELGITGKMYRKGWRCVTTAGKEQWLCYDSGEQNPADMGKLYVHGTIATDLDKLKGDATYLIDKNGYIIAGKTMVKAENGSYYATDSQGRIYKDKMITYKKYQYYFGSNGARVTWKNCWHRCPGAGNRLYYFGKKAGRVQKKTGWQKVTRSNGKFYGWFYFNKKGAHYVNKLTKSGYYFKEDGRLASGVTVIKGKSYFFEVSTSKKRAGKMVKGRMVTYKKKTYYANSKGVLRSSGWQKIDGSYYYFKNMVAVKNTYIKKGSTYGYLDNTGRFTTGWVIIDNSKNLVKYLNPDKEGFLTNTSRWIDGKLYYFDKNGYRINDLTSKYTGPYTLEVDRVNNVMTVYAENGTVPVKSIRVSVGLPESPTPLGTYYLSRAGRWQSLMGPSWGQYGSHVDGAGQGGIFVHSIACDQPNSYNLFTFGYNLLGNPASHGCIRTCVADAKWVYDHCNGSRIRIFDGTYHADEVFKGPLGRRALAPLQGQKNGGYFDPTDPAVV